MPKIKAAFFDRDGTIIKDVSYLSRLDQIEILPEVIDFCLLLQKKNYQLFIVTNQSGIARGFFDENFVINSHLYIKDLFGKNGIFFKQFYYCPHLFKECLCRKPKPGMLIQAAKEHNIDLSKSIMFGDKELDIQAGIAAGCKSFYIQDVFLNYKSSNYLERKKFLLQLNL